jgi:uncharacterized protein YbjT (DUF2867 family)
MPRPLNTVLIIGATGLVGREAIRELLAMPQVSAIDAFARKAGAAANARLRWHPLPRWAEAELPQAEAALCALGTTIKAAGSPEAFRAVDFDAVLGFARAAKAAGVKRLAVVSSLGAGADARGLYPRVKGEMEAAVAALGFDCTVIARPSLLTGDRASLGQPPRKAEKWALAVLRPLAPLIPRSWRPIEAATVARGMVVALQQAQPGVRVVESAELMRLAA